MTAIYKKEVLSFFRSMMGYLYTALLLLIAGVFFTAFNLQGGVPEFGYVLGNTTVVLLIVIPERRFVRVPARRRKGKPSGNFHCNTRWNGGKVAQRGRSLKILRDSCIHLLAFLGKALYHRGKSVYFKKAPSGAARRSE